MVLVMSPARVSVAGGASAPPAPERGPSGRDLRAILETVGLVAGPATVISALALYFGVVYTNAQAFYFGIDGSLLGLSSQAYVLRSVDALFVPVGAVVLGGLVALWGHGVLTRWLSQPSRHRAVTAAVWAMGSVGGVLFGLAAFSVFRPLPFRTPFLFAPLSLVVGMLGLSYAISLSRRRHPELSARSWIATANALLVGLVVVIGLFWGSSDYARALGRGRAQILHARLPLRPGVVVHSVQRLRLEGPGVEETVLAEAEGDYAFSYRGLRLFTRAGGNYFLLPTEWSVANGRAIVLPDDDRIRIEFTVGEAS